MTEAHGTTDPASLKARNKLRKQVIDQYRVISHLARQIAHVHEQVAILHEGSPEGMDKLLEMHGRDTAERMEIMGNILNAMDAVSDEDDWVGPIYEESHMRWPSKVTDLNRGLHVTDSGTVTRSVQDIVKSRKRQVPFVKDGRTGEVLVTAAADDSLTAPTDAGRRP